jgi:hypothetical protein
MEIDPMNNISIIIRILFAVTLFQHGSLWRTVSQEEEEEAGCFNNDNRGA